MIIVTFDGFRLVLWMVIIGMVGATYLAVMHDAFGWWL